MRGRSKKAVRRRLVKMAMTRLMKTVRRATNGKKTLLVRVVGASERRNAGLLIEMIVQSCDWKSTGVLQLLTCPSAIHT